MGINWKGLSRSKPRMLALILAVLLTFVMLSGCAANTVEAETTEETTETTETTTDTESQDAEGHATVSTVTMTEGKYGSSDTDATYDESSAGTIVFGEGIKTTGNGVETQDNQVTITAGGTYIVSGVSEDAQLIVNVTDEERVHLVFDGLYLVCSNSAPIYIQNGQTVITLADGTENAIEDGAAYTDLDEDSEPNAAIFSKDDLTFNGTGSLQVNGNYNHAIRSKDDLKIISGTYNITAASCGLVGKDSVQIQDGDISITSGKDGIRATNTTETEKGYVIIDGGSFAIQAAEDGIQAETLLLVNDGTFDITTGGGSGNAAVHTENMAGGGMQGGGMQGGEMQGGGGGMRGGMQDGTAAAEGTMPEETAPEMTEGTAPTMPEGEAPEMAAGEAPTMPEGEAPEMAAGEAPTMPEGEAPADAGTAPAESGEQTDPAAAAAAEDTTDVASTKALKSYVDLKIVDGTFQIDACDDALHSNQTITVDGGDFTIQAGDDGAHADETLTINGGNILINGCYEGLEAFDIVLNDGTIDITASDDGINAAGDSDSAANPEEEDTATETTETETTETAAADAWGGMRQGGQMMGGGMGAMGASQGATLTINGGTLTVNAVGDGLDANGSVAVNDGTITVYGPTNGGNSALDFDTEFEINGGTFFAVGSIGMAEAPTDGSQQALVTGTFSQTVSEGAQIRLLDGDGNELISATNAKSAQWYCLSAPGMTAGESYTLEVDGSSETVTAQ